MKMRLSFKLFLAIALLCLQITSGQRNGRFNFNFATLLSLKESSNQNFLGGPELEDDSPLPCTPKPECPLNSNEKFYYADGSCNNMLDGARGQAGRPHKRLMPAAYADGKSQPRRAKNGRPLPSARLVSTAMQSSNTKKSEKHAHILVIFCQFITHDITNTPTVNRDGFGVDCRCRSRDPACFNIQVPPGDLQRVEEDKICLPVVRSQPVADANCNTQIRQQHNTITPYLDAGTVYGASDFQFGQLLNESSPIGELKVGNLGVYGESPANASSLPLVTAVHHTLREVECPHDVHKPQHVPCFYAGDARANENPALASFHTLFVRMHNNLVQGLNVTNPQWSKNQKIITARMIMSAVTQRIVYKEFLPELLGQTFMNRFQLSVIDQGYWHGYDSSFDATTSTEFATAALRFGHTLVTPSLSRRTPTWTRHGSNMELKDSFFDSLPLLNTVFGGANSIMRGLCQDAAEIADTTFNGDLHNFLFRPPNRLGHDLLAINLQRGRDHGIPGYNSYREFCGLKRAKTFNDFVEIPVQERNQLRAIYGGEVDDVDLYIAGLAESPVEGGLFGPTFSCILAYQFRDIKKGDRLWHENGGENALFTPAQLETIRSYSLSRLICDTMTDTRGIQPNPFQQPNQPNNQRRSCLTFPRLDLNAWRDDVRNPLNTETTPESTAWFPAKIEGKDFGTQELLGYLLVNRPDDVCEAALGSLNKTVNGNKQIQFLCPPGSIRGTDYPNVDSSKGVWGDWEDASTPGTDDDESRSANHSCIEPFAIQVIAKQTGVPARETGEVFRTFSVTSGFVCRGEDQEDNKCMDYQVRYFCKEVRLVSQPTTPPTQAEPQFEWTAWSNLGRPITANAFSFEQELLSNVANRDGFCSNPVNIEARTIPGRIAHTETADTFAFVSATRGLQCSNPFFRRCQDYEVRYLCPVKDINGRNSLPQAAQNMKNNLCNNYQECCD